MKLLESYGKPLAYYEGAISVAVKSGSPAEGYFEAIQALDGTIVVGCFFNGDVDVEPGVVSLPIEGVTDGGWKVTLEEQKFLRERSIKIAAGSLTTTAVIMPGYFRVKRWPDYNSGYLETRFAVPNLLLSQSGRRTPSPVRFTVSDRNVEIRPTEKYSEKAKILGSIGGIEHTATVHIKASDGTRRSLDDNVKFFEELVSALRLLSGNKLGWLYCEGVDDKFKNTLEVLHNRPKLMNYTNVLSSLGWGWAVGLEALVQSYFLAASGTDGHQKLKEFIAYFTDVCSSDPYLELRALSAATLLDALALTYAEDLEKQYVLPGEEFQSGVLPGIQNAIDRTSLESDVKEQLKSNAQGLFRASFRRRLNLLNERLPLRMSPPQINDVIEARNALVHTGSFRKSIPRDKWYDDYKLLLGADFAILCRLVGYVGDFPWLN